MFGIGYGELDALVRLMHGVHPENGALVARFKYMQRMGFPEGVNPGRGVRSVFDLDALLKVLTAFELLETGATPTRVVRTVRTDWDGTRRASALGWLAAVTPEMAGARLLLVAEPHAFADLGEAEDATADVASPLRPIPIAGIGRWLNGDADGARSGQLAGSRLFIIDPLRIARSIRNLLPQISVMPLQEIDGAYAEFGRMAFGGAPQEQWPKLAGPAAV